MHFAPLPYLDPSTGSILIQVLIGVLLGLGVAIRVFWGTISKWFGIKPKAKANDDDDEPDAK